MHGRGGGAAEPVDEGYVVDAKRDRLVIVASTLGTVFEWYDFFIYGTLRRDHRPAFLPGRQRDRAFLLALASFGVGFGVRPIGAVLFGYLGDKLGRKYTFLVTITLMGIATAAVGLVPSYAAIGMAAPILLVTLRGCCRGWRWAANMAARRSTSPSMRRATSAASTPASSRRA